MASSHHRSSLAGLCRLCGEPFKRRGIPKEKLAAVIERAMSVDVALDDDEIHPPLVCELCERKLFRWKKKAQKKGGMKELGTEIGIQRAEFKGHDSDCPLCTGCPQEDEDEGEKLLKECEVQGQQCGMVAQRRSGKILLVVLDEHGNSQICLCVRHSGQWTLRAYGELVSTKKTHLKEIDDILTPAAVPALMKSVAESCLCPGNPDYLLPESMISNRPVFIHKLPEPTPNTIRHSSCPIIVPTLARCEACKIYRSDLATAHKTFSSNTSPAAKTNFRFMKPQKLAKRLREARMEKKSLKQKLSKLELKIRNMFEEEAKPLAEQESKSFAEVMTRESPMIEKEFPVDSPQRLLWEEQIKHIKTNPKGMRWHPAILRLCIALHAKSSSAYDLLRQSGFLSLPHQTTLRQYTNFTTNLPGFNADLVHRICADLKITSLHPHQTNIMLAIDEMKVNQGLVYSQATGEIVGFTDLGPLNNEFSNFAKKCNSDEPQMASHVLVVMARAICSSYRVPVAYFATSGATSDQLYWIMIEAIDCMTASGFHVRGIVSDGAAANRGLYKLLTSHSNEDNFFYNPITQDKIYLFSDAPHLLKTVRNNFENSGFNQKTRNLKFRGLEISWRHILDLYEWDFTRASSLRLLHRLTEEHLHLTPAHRMKVKYAAQVLSSSVANALKVQGHPHTASTITFIENFNLFFDCLNVSNIKAGQHKRNPALLPHTSVDDWRFTWLLEDLLGFLDEWESEGMLFPLTASERDRLVLSRQTLQGVRMTVRSFVSLCKEMLAEEGVKYILSEKFNQDPLEEYFAKQRSVGGHHDNPSVSQFGSNMLALHVAGSSIRASKRANVASTSGECSIDSTPIPRKKLFKK